MKSIIVPVNFSRCSENAGDYALDLAMAIGAEVHLIHVVQATASADMVMTEYVYQEMVDTATINLKSLQDTLKKRSGNLVTVYVHLETGGVSDAIKALCDKLRPYAVVVGASGPTFEKFLAGSPLSSVMQLTCPVLVIPDTSVFKRINRVALACDLHDLGTGIPQSLPLLRDLRMFFDTQFDVITVETPGVQHAPHPICVSDSWRAKLRDLHPELHFITKSNVEEGLQEYLTRQPADMVVVFPKKHGFFEFHTSQSRKFAKHSPIPVLSLHEE